MKIAIMGTGAMACLFAGRMLSRGHEVWMVTSWKEQMVKLASDGLLISREGYPDEISWPHVTDDASFVIADGIFPELVMISSKGYRTEQTIINALPIIGPETKVLTLQNGMGNAETIARYAPSDRVYFGAASLAAVSLELGRIRDTTNRNRTPLISIVPLSRVDNVFCKTLGELFNSLGYSTAAGTDAEPFVWKKLCLNSCANALAGISQMANKVYANDIDGFILLSKLCAECVAVARANGMPIDPDEMRAFIQRTFYNQSHYISMCQDIHHKRPTEIETINGFIVSEGRRLGIPTPVNETLYHLVRLISNHYEDRWAPETT